MKLSFDQVMLVLAGLTAGCDRASPQIVPENSPQTASGTPTAPEPVHHQSATPPPQVKAAPSASTVVTKEVARPVKPKAAAAASSAAPKEKGCAPGGCAPGKCG